MNMDISTRGPYPGAPPSSADPFSYRNPATHGSNQSLNSLSGGVCGSALLQPTPPKPPLSSSPSAPSAQRRRRGDPLPPPLPSPSPPDVKASELPAPAPRGSMPSPTTTPKPTPPTKYVPHHAPPSGGLEALPSCF